MKHPRVSVLMTIFNHQNYLKESVRSIINQSYKSWELIAIDNGSTDNSKKILKTIKDNRIKKFFLKENIGRTKCLNLGLKKCKGDFIAILDSDDVAKKNRIKVQLKQFYLNKKLWMIATDFNHIDHKGKIISYSKEKFNLKKNLHSKPRTFLLKNLVAHSSVMYKSLLIKKIGRYPDNYLYAQDYAFYLKTFKKYRIKILDQKLVNIRVLHKQSETVRVLDTNRATVEHVKLLIWNISNFNTSLYEKFLIIMRLIFQIIKLFTPKALINRRPKILN
jgi:glycosyltransferase involved in cell wall biosynthesis|tara:strand:- start:426 stop:1253 length:828 start_codon:yes stop_codon:yes gene_type:complete